MDGKKSSGDPPFSQIWAGLLGCAFGPVCCAAWAALVVRGGFPKHVK
jgi:hypothetical protein